MTNHHDEDLYIEELEFDAVVDDLKELGVSFSATTHYGKYDGRMFIENGPEILMVNSVPTQNKPFIVYDESSEYLGGVRDCKQMDFDNLKSLVQNNLQPKKNSGLSCK